MYIWKQRNGFKATYSKLMKMFERIGCRGYADEVGRIARLSASDSEVDDSSGSEEEVKQPQTYPSYTPLPVSQLPPAACKLADLETYYVVKDEEDLPEG